MVREVDDGGVVGEGGVQEGGGAAGDGKSSLR